MIQALIGEAWPQPSLPRNTVPGMSPIILVNWCASISARQTNFRSNGTRIDECAIIREFYETSQ
jgi:hypothetical protein